MARAIWFSIQTFRFSFVNGKYPPSQGQSCYFEPFLFSPNEHMKQKMKQKNNEPIPRVCVFLTSLWEQLQKRLRRITLCRYSKYVHSKLKTKATKIKKVREFWWTIVYGLLLYRKKTPSWLLVLANFIICLPTEKPRDIAFIPSTLKRVQGWRVEWIRYIKRQLNKRLYQSSMFLHFRLRSLVGRGSDSFLVCSHTDLHIDNRWDFHHIRSRLEDKKGSNWRVEWWTKQTNVRNVTQWRGQLGAPRRNLCVQAATQTFLSGIPLFHHDANINICQSRKLYGFAYTLYRIWLDPSVWGLRDCHWLQFVDTSLNPQAQPGIIDINLPAGHW